MSGYQYRGTVLDAHLPIPPDEPKRPRQPVLKPSTPKPSTPRPRPRREFQPDKCGTDQGYERHKYHKVPACPECKAAHAARRKAERHGAAA